MLSSAADSNTPALLTRISSRPNSSITAATVCLMLSGSVRSARIAMASTSSRASSRTVSSASACEPRYVIATFAPLSASRSAIARPMRFAAPVTSAVLPVSGRGPFPGALRAWLLRDWVMATATEACCWNWTKNPASRVCSVYWTRRAGVSPESSSSAGSAAGSLAESAMACPGCPGRSRSVPAA